MNKFLFALRSIGLTIVGLSSPLLVPPVLTHALCDCSCMTLPVVGPFQAADWSGRSNVMESYMAANPFAIYSMLIAHAFGAALACILLRTPPNHHLRGEPQKRNQAATREPLYCSPFGFGAMCKTIFMTCL